MAGLRRSWNALNSFLEVPKVTRSTAIDSRQVSEVWILRIASLPRDITSAELEEYFRSQNVINDAEVNRIKVTVTCVNSTTSQAIIRLHGRLTLKTGLKYSFRGHEIELDSDFHGITVLSTNGSKESIVSDVIFVHGLGGHALGSWKSQSGPEIWPLDFLPQHIRNARIMTYGYDTTLDLKNGKRHHGKKSISGIAQSMLDIIRSVRKDDEACSERPIIFLAHSLGGLIVKQALVTASKGEKSYHQLPLSNIFENCQGLIFFGVPNQGMSFQQLTYMVEGGQSEQLLRDLHVDSDHDVRPLLNRLNIDFIECIKDLELDIHSYYETRRSLPIDNEYKTNVNPQGTLIVNNDSASHTGLTVGVSSANALEGDHRSMVKFPSQNEEGYKIVQGRVEDILVGITRKKKSRTQAEKECIQSLNIHNQSNHVDRVSDAAEGTCTWIIKHPKFQGWLSASSSNLLLLSGKSGSGKSVLAKSIHKAVSGVIDDTAAIAVIFAFNGRGVVQEQSLHGMLCSLLYQIFSKHTSILRLTTTMADYKHLEQQLRSQGDFKSPKKIIWPTQMLHNILFSLCEADIPTIYIIVDALDESLVVITEAVDSEANVIDTAADVYALLQQLASARETTFKICLTSRPQTLSRVADFPSYSIISLEDDDFTQEDIKTYASGRVIRIFPGDKKRAFANKLIQHLVVKSEGVFLWVKLVLNILAEDRSAPHSKLLRTLDDVPKGMTALYTEMLGRLKKSHHADRQIMLQWVLFARRPLSLVEYRRVVLTSTLSTEHEDDDVEPEEPDMQEFYKWVDIASCGLVEIRSVGDGEGIVQLVHQSAQDFLLGHPTLWISTSEESPFHESHRKILRTCLNILGMRSAAEMIRSYEEAERYAMDYWTQHMERVTAAHVDENIKAWIRSWTQAKGQLRRYSSLWNLTEARGWDYDSRWGYEFSSKYRKLHLLYFSAVEDNRPQLLQCLLEIMDDIDDVYVDCRSTTLGALHSGLVELAPQQKSLTRPGFRVRNAQGATALTVARRAGHSAIIELLTAQGAVMED